MRIARRFNAGNSVKETGVPKGRLKHSENTERIQAFSAVPSGLNGNLRQIPALKRRAIVGGPFGTINLL
jgi:hypothetical protein